MNAEGNLAGVISLLREMDNMMIELCKFPLCDRTIQFS